jgi:hypothetical protein
MYGRDVKYTQFWLEYLEGRQHLEDLGIDGIEVGRM